MTRTSRLVFIVGTLIAIFANLLIDLGGTLATGFHLGSVLIGLFWAVPLAFFWLAVRTERVARFAGAVTLIALVGLLYLALRDESSTAGVWLFVGPFLLLLVVLSSAAIDAIVRGRSRA